MTSVTASPPLGAHRTLRGGGQDGSQTNGSGRSWPAPPDGRVEVSPWPPTSVAEETVRRDLRELVDRGVLQRVHGGAYPVESAGFESNLAHRSTSLVAEKRRDRRRAAERLHGAETVYIDEGVTPQFVAEAIGAPENPITVVTSSLLAAGALADAPDITVLLLGGRVRGRTLATVDHWALRMLGDLVIDLAFLGANGISREHGLTTPDPAVAAVKARWSAGPGGGSSSGCTPSSASRASAGSPTSPTSRSS